MKKIVNFAMCHNEEVEIELDDEDLKGMSEGEIDSLVESMAWRKIKEECPYYDADEIIEVRDAD